MLITPQKKYSNLAKAVGVSSLYLKREDLHPYGSHKGRSIPVMIEHYVKNGKRHFAISSSGNAALAAAMYVKKLNGKVPSSKYLVPSKDVNDSVLGTRNSKLIRLEILVGNHILDKKLKKLTDLADENISVMRFERPLQTLTQKTADGSIQSLRQSTDDIALVGYESLAEELEKIKNLQAIFIATSSGTTAQALARYFEKVESRKYQVKSQDIKDSGLGTFDSGLKPIEIHIVQTTSCHPIALEFVDSVPSEEQSSADAIVDMIAHRKNPLIPLIKETNGSGWIATNEEINTAQELIEKNAKIKVSPNGALALAGLIQAVFTGKELDGAVVCVVGGE
jgi:hypothetical protein